VRLYIDECLSPLLAIRLNETGRHDAAHPLHLGGRGESDHSVLARCIADDRVVVTGNARDFRRLVVGAELHPGLIILPSIVLVDAYPERLETLLTPERRSALVRLNVRAGSDTVEPIPGYGDIEIVEYGKDNVVMRQAAARAPLGPMPLAVLAHARPFDLSPDQVEGFSSEALEAVLRAANENLATLVPNARFFVAKDRRHYIHQDQPELVTEAIREVVAAVRNPDAWYDLTSCRAK